MNSIRETNVYLVNAVRKSRPTPSREPASLAPAACWQLCNSEARLGRRPLASKSENARVLPAHIDVSARIGKSEQACFQAKLFCRQSAQASQVQQMP